LRTLKGFTSDVTSVAFSPTEPLVAAGSLDRTIIIWDTCTGEALQTLTAQTGPVYGVGFSPDGSTLVTLEISAEWEGTTTLWDVNTGAALRSLHQLSGCAPENCRVRTGDVEVSPVQPIVAVSELSGTCDTFLLVWDLRTGSKVKGIVSSCLKTLQIYPPIGIAFNPDGSVVAVASSTGVITLMSMASDSPTHLESLNPSLQFAIDTPIIKKELQIPGGNAGATDLDWSPDGQWLAVGTPNPSVVLLDSATLDVVLQQDGPTANVTSVTFSPDGKILATGLADGTILLWSVTTTP